MPTFIIPPVDISTSPILSYNDVDVSSSVSASATAAIIRISGTTADSTYVRKNGSTDDRYTTLLTTNGHKWAIVGLDANKIFEMKVASLTDDCHLYGYLESECTMLTNGTDKSTTTTGSYVDVDISTDTGASTAVAAIAEYYFTSASASKAFYARKNGSTDDRYTTPASSTAQVWGNFIIGVDGSELFEQKIASTECDLYLTGYITSSCTMNTNGTDRSLGGPASWTDLTALPAGAIGGIYEPWNTSSSTNYSYGFRKNGDTTAHYLAISQTDNYQSACMRSIIACDNSQIVEGIIDNTAVDFYEMGYFTAPTTTRRIFCFSVSS